jgi:hypothetical protein
MITKLNESIPICKSGRTREAPWPKKGHGSKLEFLTTAGAIAGWDLRPLESAA